MNAIKETPKKTYLERLNEYEAFDIKNFIKTDLNKNKVYFYKKNYKFIIPFIFRKNRKIDFISFVARRSKYINEIKDLHNRLDSLYKEGSHSKPVKIDTQRVNLKATVGKILRQLTTKKQITLEDYKYEKLMNKVQLCTQRMKLMQKYVELNNKIKKGIVTQNSLKERANIKDNIEKISIKLYEAQKYK